jgi:hypothetical protein
MFRTAAVAANFKELEEVSGEYHEEAVRIVACNAEI